MVVKSHVRTTTTTWAPVVSKVAHFSESGLFVAPAGGLSVMMVARDDVGGGTGSARRRRERRLRAYLKYVRMSVAISLAESQSAPQRTAPEDGKGRRRGTS